MSVFEFPRGGSGGRPGGGGPGGPGRLDLGTIDFARIRRLARWALLALGALLALRALTWAAGFYTDWLWFRELGHESVLLRIVTARIVLFALGVAVFLGLALPALRGAARATDRPPLAEGLVAPLDYVFVHKFLVRAAAVAVALAALLLALYPAAEWETVLLALNAPSFGQADPIFGRDLAFHIFSVPALELAQSWLLAALAGLALILVAFHYVTGVVRGDPAWLAGAAGKWLAVLAAGMFLLLGVGHWLGRYELLLSSTGTVFGVGWTEHRVQLPGRALLAVAAAATAGLILWGAFRARRGGDWVRPRLSGGTRDRTGLRLAPGWRWFVYPVAGWLALLVLVEAAVPAAVQRLRVEPAELALERDYLAHNIAFTRRAFGLEGMATRSHPARGALDRATIDDNQGTLRNVRLWDEGPLLQSYNQIQFFRLYYDFLAVHTDRYRVDGELRQVMLATRELSAEKLPAEAQRWVNRRLQFTHGYGVAMSPVTEVQAGGRPTFFLRDVPPVGEVPLERPEIYYGLQSLDYVVARSGMEEFNYPGPEGPVYTHYEGRGGVELGSLSRRLLYAWQFGDLNLLISGEIEPESRIQYRRTVPARVGEVAPFLMRDREPYAVVAEGRVFWIQDAYTVTERFPYATPWADRFNYIRNSVKAVVDAYDGSVDFYLFDSDDPLARAYGAIFPGLFRPREEMPEALQAHVRVPLDLFTVQTQMLLQYHMEDPVVFYNREDQWDVPVQTSFGRPTPLRPYYIVARLPGEEEEEFLLIQPFTPDNRHNLVGWMAARNDGDRYGERILFRFPTGRHVDGPSQIEARIDNDAVISEQFTLWGQVGSEVMRGILLVIPIGDAILYAEPVFLRPETLEFPELRRIILADSRQVVMHQTMDASVAALVGERPAVAPVAAEVGEEEAALAAADPTADPEEVAARREAVERAAAERAVRARDAELEALREELEQTIERLQAILDRLNRGSP